MKQNLISLMVLISLSFQMTYPQTAPAVPEAKKGKLRMLYQKYGKAKVDGAISAIKRYGPWAIITNYKKAKAARIAAGKELKLAEAAVESCKSKVCQTQKSKLDAARKEQNRLWSLAHHEIASWNEYYAARDAAGHRTTKYNNCWLPYCGQEEEKRAIAEQNYGKAYIREAKFEVFLAVGGTLGFLAVLGGLIGTGIYYEEKDWQKRDEEAARARQIAEETRTLEQETEAALQASKELMPELGQPVQEPVTNQPYETSSDIEELEALEQELGEL